MQNDDSKDTSQETQEKNPVQTSDGVASSKKQKKQKPKTFLELTEFQDLVKTKTLEETVFEFYKIVNKSRAVAEAKTLDVFYKSGRLRSVSSIPPDEITFLQSSEMDSSLISEGSKRESRITSRYINTVESPKKAIAIVIFLMSISGLGNFVKGLDIKREPIKEKITSFYENSDSTIKEAFNKFFSYGFSEEFVSDRSMLLEKNSLSKIVNKFKSYAQNGLLPEEDEVEAFKNALVVLRKETGDAIDPNIKSLCKHFDISESSFRFYIADAKTELANLLYE